MAEVTEQIIREAPEIEALKVGLIKSAKTLSEQPLAIPAYEAAGLSDLQKQAMGLAGQGIGAYAPFLQAGQGAMEAGIGSLGQAQQAAAGINLAPQFNVAQQAMERGLGMIPYGAELGGAQGLLAQAAGQTAAVRPEFGGALGAIGAGLGTAGQIGAAGTPALSAAERSLAAATGQIPAGANLFPSQAMLGQAATGAMGGAGGYNPAAAQAFMNPYQQAVTQQALGEMRRQADIARQGQAAQAVRAGAFGGTREGVQRAEFERGVQDVMGQRIMQDYAQNYAQAQQAAQQAFEAQQQRQLSSAGQLAGIGGTLGQQALSQAQLGQAGAGLLGQLGTQQAQLGSQQAGLLAQQAGLQGSLGAQLANIEAQRAQLGLSGAGQLANIGQTLGAQQLSQAQIGQAGAGLMGQLGQGIGSLAAQYGGMGLQQASTLGSLGQAFGQSALQQAQLGEAAQRMGLQDISLLSALGQTQQQAEQARLEASRATALQKALTPYQQLSFLSDIYKGAPGTQMALTAGTAPSTSPLLQAAGLGVAGLSAAAGASRAGLF